MGISVEVFLSEPPCPNSLALARLVSEVADEFGEEVEVITYEGRTELFDRYNLTATPAVVVDELVKMMGFCPSKESLISALKEVGLE
jgi:hypothetical protein